MCNIIGTQVLVHNNQSAWCLSTMIIVYEMKDLWEANDNPTIHSLRVCQNWKSNSSSLIPGFVNLILVVH